MTLVKDAFTDVFSWDNSEARVVKDAFTIEFVEVTDAFSCDKPKSRVVKDAFTIEFVELTDVFN
jgi:hypothetical protein